VRRLRFADEPDYEFMKACVMKELISQRMSLAAPFDWQSLRDPNDILLKRLVT
jgi:hypothetical protein